MILLSIADKDQLVTKADLRAELRAKIAHLQLIVWMPGFNLVLSLAILGKLLA